MKKILITLGAIGAITAPAIAITNCGCRDHSAKERTDQCNITRTYNGIVQRYKFTLSERQDAMRADKCTQFVSGNDTNGYWEDVPKRRH